MSGPVFESWIVMSGKSLWGLCRARTDEKWNRISPSIVWRLRSRMRQWLGIINLMALHEHCLCFLDRTVREKVQKVGPPRDTEKEDIKTG